MRRLSASVLFVFVVAAGFGVAACSSSEPDSYPPGLPWLGGQVETGEAELPNRRDGGTRDGGGGTGADYIPDTSTTGLASFLPSTRYEHWQNTGSRSIDEAHGGRRGRVFANPTLYEALRAAPPYPDYSDAILWVLDSQGEVIGYNVLAKRGSRWLFYRSGSPLIHSVEPAECTSCHTAGSDYILTPRSAF